MSKISKSAVNLVNRNLLDAKLFITDAVVESAIVPDAILIEKVSKIAKALDETVEYINSRTGEQG